MDVLERIIARVDWEDLMLTGLKILLVLVLFWVVLMIVKTLLRRLEHRLIQRGKEEGEVPTESAKRAETLVRLLRQGVVIVLWVVALLVVLREMGMDIGPILASAGVVGLAVGFGAQNLVRDVISGFFMILENQVRVGDVAIVNGTGGLVEAINFRTIILRDLAGTVHVFPNGAISTISNMTKEWSAYVFNLGVAYKEDVDRVSGIIKSVAQGLREDPHFGALMIEDAEIFGLDQFGDSAIVIKGRLKTKPIKQWEVGREFQRRIKQAFDEQGVEIPFPHRSIYFGEASQPFLARLLNERPPGDDAESENTSESDSERQQQKNA